WLSRLFNTAAGQKMPSQIEKLFFDRYLRKSSNKKPMWTRLFSLLLFIFFTFCLLGNDSLTLHIIQLSEEYTNQSEYEKAVHVLQDYLTDLEDKESVDAASIYHKLGINYYYTDQLDAAIEAVSNALEIRYEVLGENHPDTQNSLFLRSGIYRAFGLLEESLSDLNSNIESIKKDEKLTAKKRDSILISRYDDLGILYLVAEQYYDAILYWEQVKNYRIATYGAQDLSVYQVEDQLATAYKSIGAYETAIELYEKTITFYEAADLQSELCIVYNNLAATYELIEESEKAAIYYAKAAESCDKAQDRINLLEVYKNQIENYTRLGKYDDAQLSFDKGIALSKEMSEQVFDAELYSNLGNLKAAQAQFDEALQHFATAIKILVPDFIESTKNSNPTPTQYHIQSKYDLLTTLTRKAAVLTEKGTKNQSIATLEKALQTYEDINELIDAIRLGYRMGKSKFLLLKKSAQWYEKAIETALLLHQMTEEEQYLQKAYQFNASNKSVVLLDALQEEFAKSFVGLPEEVLEEERKWKKDIHDVETQLYGLRATDEAASKNDKERLFQLKQNYQDFIQNLEQHYPEYYALKYAFRTSPTVSEIQDKLAEESLLLEYFLGDQNAYVFALSKNSFQLHKIENAKQIVTDIQSISHFLRHPNSTPQSKKEYLFLAHKTYQSLLAPALENANSTQQLIIIPDGELAQISFESLLYEASNTLSTATPFLLQKYAISYLYSSRFLFSNQTHQEADALFGGFGIEYDENTLESLENKNLAPTQSRSVALRSMGKLIYSDDEVLAIAALLKGQSWINEAATKTAFLENAHRFRILHLAMHGVLNEEQPLQSALIFTKEEGKNDHFLRAGGLYNFKLNADMVVLSACNTGAGQINKGEGVRSLARAFQYAGASSLVASLWSAPDQTTKDISVNFYEYLKAGENKAIALQKAKLDYLNDPNTSPEYAHPNYWAHLIAIGDVKALRLENTRFWWLIGGILLIIMVLLLVLTQKQ
ncbi:MAG: CHAT domain-containing tetratricopeptide repeat protein, partial [Bacteroidota bacterium]